MFSRGFDEKHKFFVNFKHILKISDDINRKAAFETFLETLFIKIEHSEITSFFYNNFFNFGGGTLPVFPLATPLLRTYQQQKLASEQDHPD